MRFPINLKTPQLDVNKHGLHHLICRINFKLYMCETHDSWDALPSILKGHNFGLMGK